MAWEEVSEGSDLKISQLRAEGKVGARVLAGKLGSWNPGKTGQVSSWRQGCLSRHRPLLLKFLKLCALFGCLHLDRDLGSWTGSLSL